MSNKLTVTELRALKGTRKIVMCSAFDYFNAKACEAAGIDAVVTAGNYINYFVRGRVTANDDTLEDGLLALEGVRNGAPNTFIIVRPPFSDEFNGIEQTLSISSKLYAAGADAIKLQGTSDTKLKKMEAMTEEGIPVGAHIGLMPRFTTWIGGFVCQGKRAKDAIQIFKDAKNVEAAGANWIELECVPYKVAAEITKRIGIPIIGIGSGPDCDGEVQVHLDTLGLQDIHIPKHSKVYFNYFNESIKHLTKYKNEVLNNTFPTVDYGFKIKDDEFDLFINSIEKIT